jgi:hypothetical protein
VVRRRASLSDRIGLDRSEEAQHGFAAGPVVAVTVPEQRHDGTQLAGVLCVVRASPIDQTVPRRAPDVERRLSERHEGGADRRLEGGHHQADVAGSLLADRTGPGAHVILDETGEIAEGLDARSEELLGHEEPVREFAPVHAERSRNEARNRSDEERRLDIGDANGFRHLSLQRDRLLDREGFSERHQQVEVREPFDEVTRDDAPVRRQRDESRKDVGVRLSDEFDETSGRPSPMAGFCSSVREAATTRLVSAT